MHAKVKSFGASEIARVIGGTKKVTQIPATHEFCSIDLSNILFLFSTDDMAHGFQTAIVRYAERRKLRVPRGSNL